MSHREIAEQFRLSRASINAIVRHDAENRQLTERSAALLENIRQADDVDRKWPTGGLIEALRPLMVARTALLRHFDRKGANEISLH